MECCRCAVSRYRLEVNHTKNPNLHIRFPAPQQHMLTCTVLRKLEEWGLHDIGCSCSSLPFSLSVDESESLATTETMQDGMGLEQNASKAGEGFQHNLLGMPR